MISIQTTETFYAWLHQLKDKRGKAAIEVRLRRAESGNFGDCEPVGEGVSEMHIHYGSGYRVYFIRRGLEMVVMLAGCNKSTQAIDIKTALQRRENFRRTTWR